MYDYRCYCSVHSQFAEKMTQCSGSCSGNFATNIHFQIGFRDIGYSIPEISPNGMVHRTGHRFCAT